MSLCQHFDPKLLDQDNNAQLLSILKSIMSAWWRSIKYMMHIMIYLNNLIEEKKDMIMDVIFDWY